MLGGYLLYFRYYGHGAGGFGNETGHGVTGMTSPLLLMASMQFFSISWPGRLGFPASVSWFPGPVIAVARRCDQAVDCHVRAQVKRVAVHNQRS